MPIRIGIPMKNTIVVPCIVNNWLNTSGARKSLRGEISCHRIRTASTPPTIRKTRLIRM
jgi:hypothetical protein